MRLGLFLGVLLFASSPAMADPFADYLAEASRIEREMRAEREAREAACSAETAVDVPFAELAFDGVSYHDQCVRVEGLAYGREIFAFPAQAYLADHFRAHSVSYEDRNPFRLGMEDWLAELRIDGTMYAATVIGIARDCTAEDGRYGGPGGARALSEGYFIVSSNDGFCGWQGYGTTIVPAIIEYGAPVRFPRMMQQERPAFLTLRPIHPSQPIHALGRDFALDFQAQLRAGDAAALAEWNEQFGVEETADMFAHRASASLESLRANTATQPPRLFSEVRRWEEPRAGTPYVPESTTEAIVACFCREENCTERWPITWFDVTPKPDQPYVCVTGIAQWDEAGSITVEPGPHTSVFFRGPSPFHEPDSPAPN